MSLDHFSHQKTELIQHLIELRQRLLITVVFFVGCFCLSYFFAEDIFVFLSKPLMQALDYRSNGRLIYTGISEAFVCYLKVALFSASFLSFPLMLQQIWSFIAPGLYVKERKVFLPILVATPLLFVLGAAFAYYCIIPNAWKFFLKFESLGSTQSLPIQFEARVIEYFSSVLQIIMAFGICFELPVVLLVLAIAKLVRSQDLIRSRKYAFLLILIVSALLTPPDVLSMIGLALPLYSLFEISILMIKCIEKGMRPTQ